MLANSSGRAITSSTAIRAVANHAAVVAEAALMPKMEPNSTLAFAVEFPAARWVVYTARKNTPRPSTQAIALPMMTSSATARPPSRPIPTETATVAVNRPTRGSMPAASAASAPA
jgi:hypothetical protein